MGIAKNAALAHALVSLGSCNLADVFWINVDVILPSLCIPSLANTTGTMELGLAHYRGFQFVVSYVHENRCTDPANYQQSETYTHAGFLAIQVQRINNFETPQMLQKQPEVYKALNAFQKTCHTAGSLPEVD